MAELLKWGLVAGLGVNWRSWTGPEYACRSGDDGRDYLDGIISDLRVIIWWWIKVAPDEQKAKLASYLLFNDYFKALDLKEIKLSANS